MAKFCTNCGRKLEKDEKCVCEKVKVKKQNADSLFDQIKKFVKEPFDVLKQADKYKENNYLILLLTAISSGLLSSLFILNINTVTMMIFTFIALLLYTLFINIFTKQNNFNDVLTLTSVSSIYLLIGNVIAFLCIFISNILPLIVIISSLILFILSCYQSLCFDNELDKNKNAYYIVLSLIATIVILMILVLI